MYTTDYPQQEYKKTSIKKSQALHHRSDPQNDLKRQEKVCRMCATSYRGGWAGLGHQQQVYTRIPDTLQGCIE